MVSSTHGWNAGHQGVKLHHHHICFCWSEPWVHTRGVQVLREATGFEDYLEVWLRVDEELFSDEIKGMERLLHRLEAELTQELGAPVTIRLKEEGSFRSPALSYRIEDLR